MNKKAILVTGGTGFIGSHACVELINAGYDVIVVDNLVNSHEKSLDRVQQITGKRPLFFNFDVRSSKTSTAYDSFDMRSSKALMDLTMDSQDSRSSMEACHLRVAIPLK